MTAGFWPHPEFDTAREREIFLRIRRRYRRRNHFILHLFAFVGINAGMWIDWLDMTAYRYDAYAPYSLGPRLGFMAFWGVVLLLHYIRLRMGEAEDRELENALEREYERQQPLYYEEMDEYYGDYAHLSDDPAAAEYLPEPPQVKRKTGAR